MASTSYCSLLQPHETQPVVLRATSQPSFLCFLQLGWGSKPAISPDIPLKWPPCVFVIACLLLDLSVWKSTFPLVPAVLSSPPGRGVILLMLRRAQCPQPNQTFLTLPLPRKPQLKFRVRAKSVKGLLIVQILQTQSPTLDEQRAANIERNARVARSLGITTSQTDSKETVPARKGVIRSITGCVDRFVLQSDLAHHLLEHCKRVCVRDLIPCGLSVCPFCRGVYCTSRGWKVHVLKCKSEHVQIESLLSTPLPRMRRCGTRRNGTKVWRSRPLLLRFPVGL